MNRKLTIIFSLAIIFSGCSSKNNSVREYVKNADSASIAFYASSDSSSRIVIKDKSTIKKLGEYIDGKPMQPGKCSDSGSIWFYEGTRKKMQVDFSLNSGCNYFSYMMNDKIYAKTMSEDATQYLNGIMEIASDTL
jgi:hypothetical protein